MDNKLIGQYIRTYRERKGLSQAQLAEKVNIAPNTLSLFERGEKTPGRDVLFDLALTLDFSIDEMIQNSNYSGCTIHPNEITELMNQLTVEQRKIVLTTTKAMIMAFLEE